MNAGAPRVLRRVTVYCGSSGGSDPSWRRTAEEFGRLLASREIGLVYGGGNVGLMGEVADGVLRGGGHVTGIIPESLAAKELAHRGIQDLRIVKTMHERKALMAELCDGFVALPGSLGTMDELFEALTWGQLGIHSKPVGILNVRGYYDALLVLLDRFLEEGFLRPPHRTMLLVRDAGGALLDAMRTYEPPAGPKWLELDEA